MIYLVRFFTKIGQIFHIFMVLNFIIELQNLIVSISGENLWFQIELIPAEFDFKIEVEAQHTYFQ